MLRKADILTCYRQAVRNPAANRSLIVFGGHLYRDPAASIGRGTVVVRPIVFLPIIIVLGLAIYGLIFLLRSLLPQDRSSSY